MSRRLTQGGRLIDRQTSVSFSFNGKQMRGHAGDTLASALLANGQMLVGRSFKYHRPRGIMTSGPEEPNALVNLGRGTRHEPNQRATTTEVFERLQATSQNHWPSLEFDVGAINQLVARFLPAGFYYKTFMFPRAFWKHVFEPVIRQSAGLGKAPEPENMDADRYEHFYAHTDIVIAGGGIAGLQAAVIAGRAGVRVLLMEQSAHWGGRAPVDGDVIDDMLAQDWINNAVQELEKMKNVEIRLRTMVAGVYDHGYVLGYERLTDHAPETDAPRHRLWRIRAGQIISATGALERPLSFAGNDKPGVMLASAVRDYIADFGVAVGETIVVVTNNDDAYRTAIAAAAAGLKIACVVDARQTADGELPNKARSLGIDVKVNAAIARVRGMRGVRSVVLCPQDGDDPLTEEVSCDAIAMSGGWSPVVHLWSHCGGKLTWDEDAAFFRPDAARPPLNQNGEGFVACAGAAEGALQGADSLRSASTTTSKVLTSMGKTGSSGSTARSASEAGVAATWIMPRAAGHAQRHKMWLDFQNDVKVSDVQLAAQEGYESVEHTKRYTTLGMATDQGKLSNINGLAVLADALNEQNPPRWHDDLSAALYADLHGGDCRRGPRRDLPAAAPHADASVA